MSKMIEALQSKFSEYQIPAKVADSFLSEYRFTERGLLPEIEFGDVPSDDCFKTLQTYCLEVKEAPEPFLVHKLLQVPFSKIAAAKEKLNEFVDMTVMQDLWSRNDMYFINSEFIEKLITFLKSKDISKDYYSKWFPDALILGEGAIDRVNVIFELFDEETAKKIVSEAAIWYPFSDIAGLIAYSKEQGLIDSQICKIMIADPILIMCYRGEDYRRPGFGHDQEYVDYVISRVKAGE